MDSDIFLPYGYMQSQQNTQKSPYPPHFSSTQLNAPESDRKLQDAAGESFRDIFGEGVGPTSPWFPVLGTGIV